ncbi:hypothetical protein SAMN04489732_10388 [Amycolatopsis saalfeldensis]|uniref:Lipoprotein n=2 Tax=Amycolatopsis saalfeldensis TaxID=394193 RepID=A0A1H8U755_9PSEU|nr:hypothetical protein SAMN04489732_10388 [Amycolatopsis saalfeldensis]
MTMRALPVLAAVCLLAAGCSAAPPDPGPVFDNEASQAVGCMKHQTTAPGARYTDPSQVRTDETLPLLRYYTANGRKRYCDGAAPSDVDRAWAGLYVRLGAQRANVAGILR